MGSGPTTCDVAVAVALPGTADDAMGAESGVAKTFGASSGSVSGKLISKITNVVVMPKRRLVHTDPDRFGATDLSPPTQ